MVGSAEGAHLLIQPNANPAIDAVATVLRGTCQPAQLAQSEVMRWTRLNELSGQIAILIGVIVVLCLLFPAAYAFVEAAARELRYLWWLILLLALAAWFYLGDKSGEAEAVGETFSRWFQKWGVVFLRGRRWGVGGWRGLRLGIGGRGWRPRSGPRRLMVVSRLSGGEAVFGDDSGEAAVGEAVAGVLGSTTWE